MRVPSFYLLPKNKGELAQNYTIKTPIEGFSADTGFLYLMSTGLLTIHKGYVWDFGTGAVDTPAVLVASLVHDALCELIAKGELPKSVRKDADKYYKWLLTEAGMSRIRVFWQYYGIRTYVRFIKPWWG